MYLEYDRDSRRQGLRVEEVELPSLAFLVQEAGQENGQDEHACDDDCRNDESQEIVCRRQHSAQEGAGAAAAAAAAAILIVSRWRRWDAILVQKSLINSGAF